MKLFLLALSAVFITLSTADDVMDEKSMLIQEMKHKVHDCAGVEKASQDDLDKIFNTQIPTTHEGKCTLFCMHKKYNVQDEDGTLDLEGTRATLKRFTHDDPNGILLEQAFENCHSISVNPDPCEYAGDIGNCVLAESKKLGLTEIIIE